MARRHLAIFLRGVAEKIISKEKKVEIRLSKTKSAPYLQVSKGDEILLKVSGGKVIGSVVADNVLFYDNLTPKAIEDLETIHSSDAAMDDGFWKGKSNSKYATVIFLKNPKQFISPITFKKNDQRAWIVLEK